MKRPAVFLAPFAVAALVSVAAVRPAAAQINVQIGVGIPLPPPIVFAAPPQMVVLPQTYVYAAPDLADEVYFVDGFWWRPWQGRWYRSSSYDRGWSYYDRVPSFYTTIPRDWRRGYADHRWNGNPWNYERMPHDRVEKNWKGWKESRHWQGSPNWVAVPGPARNTGGPGPGKGHDKHDDHGKGHAPKGKGKK